ncbi:hypothetical protein GMRT_11293 [Giardia muris]|uniref:Uncharacterized protein n=1 Tax=Giardia muris TaxID=5742 RepID=A0A4Z1T2Y0_GIAMU|nr:hypothetical protein GMRT_11293 [Giardia muris]|eukprot:TNJ27417.1 hypothetical protein GMRT_11293 [Giardia muris]
MLGQSGGAIQSHHADQKVYYRFFFDPVTHTIQVPCNGTLSSALIRDCVLIEHKIRPEAMCRLELYRKREGVSGEEYVQLRADEMVQVGSLIYVKRVPARHTNAMSIADFADRLFLQAAQAGGERGEGLANVLDTKQEGLKGLTTTQQQQLLAGIMQGRQPREFLRYYCADREEATDAVGVNFQASIGVTSRTRIKSHQQKTAEEHDDDDIPAAETSLKEMWQASRGLATILFDV